MQQSGDLKLAIQAVEKAAQIVKEGFGKVTQFVEKEGKGIVTEIDHKSEETIIKILQQGSNCPILAEESGQIGETGDTFWVIDPLDGTTNFSRGIPIFCVSVALIKNRSVVLGVTLNPLTGDVYFAEKGKNAFLNGEKIRVSGRSDKLVIALNKGYSREADRKYIKVTEVLSPAATLRRLGSTALELTWAAQGLIEGFLDFGDELWDYAAGSLLISEAGGKVTDWKGQDWGIDSKYILATNGLVHDEIKGSIENLQTI